MSPFIIFGRGVNEPVGEMLIAAEKFDILNSVRSLGF